ncbi:juvenile hormone esterase-like [Planococcus citri]|uniref:juvenile hormone esterase-like n=1 Tax=Planococcus citri TaxID=170843 RepID=UPI0031F7486A
MTVHILLFCAVIFFGNFANGVELQTKQGILKGQLEKSRDGRMFYSFYGIPYAEPPVGELRFKDPVPAKPWKGVRDGSILPSPCLQYYILPEIRGSEDCLYLNLYTPKLTNETLLPVMVYMHGSRFLYRDALPDKYGPHYFMDKDVVLIIFHYRLGSLGFLSTEDEIIPGNYGLKDTVEVLRWVQNHIEDFGGDKNRVTLFGASSAATSVSMTLLSPLAKGLIHRLITQSGHPFDLERPGKARVNAWKLASLVGCDGDEVKTSQDLLNCLKKLPAEKFVSYDSLFFSTGGLLPAFPWGPVIENEKVPGAFLVDEPAKLIERQSNIPWMMGINSDEGGEVAINAYHRKYGPPLADELDREYKRVFPLMFRYIYHVKDPEQLDNVTETYKKYFFGDKKISEDIHGFAKMFTTLIYVTGLKQNVKLYKGPKYVYYYNYKAKESFTKTLEVEGHPYMGIIHGDELLTLYNWSSVITPVTEGVDLAVSKQMVDFWTNFAAAGNPNDKEKTIWKPVDSQDINYLHIKDGKFEMRDKLLKEEYEFLESVPVDGYF